MIHPLIQPRPQPNALLTTPNEPPGAPKGHPPLTLWSQLAPGHQRQLSQQVAELIHRIRQHVNTREGQNDDVNRAEL